MLDDFLIMFDLFWPMLASNTVESHMSRKGKGSQQLHRGSPPPNGLLDVARATLDGLPGTHLRDLKVQQLLIELAPGFSQPREAVFACVRAVTTGSELLVRMSLGAERLQRAPLGWHVDFCFQGLSKVAQPRSLHVKSTV